MDASDLSFNKSNIIKKPVKKKGYTKTYFARLTGTYSLFLVILAAENSPENESKVK